MNTEYFLPQIADVLERIESHLAVIARLLAAHQGVTLTIGPTGRSVVSGVARGAGR